MSTEHPNDMDKESRTATHVLDAQADHTTPVQTTRRKILKQSHARCLVHRSSNDAVQLLLGISTDLRRARNVTACGAFLFVADAQCLYHHLCGGDALGLCACDDLKGPTFCDARVRLELCACDDLKGPTFCDARGRLEPCACDDLKGPTFCDAWERLELCACDAQ